MNLPYTLYQNEIPAKGVGYLVLHDPDKLEEGFDALVRLGATKVLASGAVREGETELFHVTHSHDLLRMERPLEGCTPPSGKLRLEPLREKDAAVYIQIYNESFFAVPNGATMSRGDLEPWYRPDRRAGIAWLGTRPVGVYGCILHDDCGEIDGLGLIKTMRGLGLGCDLLRELLVLLGREGRDRCRLTVATANEAAFGLYREEGFTVTEKVSAWYEVCRRA